MSEIETLRARVAELEKENERLNAQATIYASGVSNAREVIDKLQASDKTVYGLLVEYFHGNLRGSQQELHVALSAVFNLIRQRAEQAEARVAELIAPCGCNHSDPKMCCANAPTSNCFCLAAAQTRIDSLEGALRGTHAAILKYLLKYLDAIGAKDGAREIREAILANQALAPQPQASGGEEKDKL